PARLATTMEVLAGQVIAIVTTAVSAAAALAGLAVASTTRAGLQSTFALLMATPAGRAGPLREAATMPGTEATVAASTIPARLRSLPVPSAAIPAATGETVPAFQAVVGTAGRVAAFSMA